MSSTTPVSENPVAITHAAEKAADKAEEQIEFWLERFPPDQMAYAFRETARKLLAQADYWEKKACSGGPIPQPITLREDRVGFDSPEYAARIGNVRRDVESLNSRNPNAPKPSERGHGSFPQEVGKEVQGG